MNAPSLLRTLVVALLLALGAAALACSDREDSPTPTPTTAGGTPTATASAPATQTAPATSTAPPTATTAPPTATTTRPAATATPSGPVVGQLIYNGPRSSNLVALTFDMGGRVEPALDIMNYLIANKIRSTIFMTGAMAANQNTEAGRDVLRLIEKHPELFDLGNHSYTHPDFRDLTAAQMKDELERTERAMAPYTTQSARPLFRPPFGGQNASVVQGVAAAGYPKVIMWDIDTIDWRPEADGGPTAAFMTNKVVSNAQGGTIVLMHLGGYNTLEALPGMIQGLRNKGLQFATVSEMLGIGD